eukprot:365900-Chlamydomonas_euryale.AAC.16
MPQDIQMHGVGMQQGNRNYGTWPLVPVIRHSLNCGVWLIGREKEGSGGKDAFCPAANNIFAATPDAKGLFRPFALLPASCSPEVGSNLWILGSSSTLLSTGAHGGHTTTEFAPVLRQMPHAHGARLSKGILRNKDTLQ